ncbi:MAG: VOC family protein [Cyanobacteria bacterium J06638_20]
MGLGAVMHLALRVSDRPRSEVFYDWLLTALGYTCVAQTDRYTMWWSAQAGAITLSDADPIKTATDQLPGLHHFALAAESSEQVDRIYQRLQVIGAQILHPPKSIENSSMAYYSVLFTDPDGLRLELVYMPGNKPQPQAATQTTP